VRVEVKLLKDETDLGPQFGQIGGMVVQGMPSTNSSPFWNFSKAIDAADERGFARAAGAAHHHHFSGGDMQIDVPEDMQLAEPFVDAVESDHVCFPYGFRA
jgi:hypothetical protein